MKGIPEPDDPYRIGIGKTERAVCPSIVEDEDIIHLLSDRIEGGYPEHRLETPVGFDDPQHRGVDEQGRIVEVFEERAVFPFAFAE